MLLTLIGCAVLSACGGGSPGPVQPIVIASAPVAAEASAPAVQAPPAQTPALTAPGDPNSGAAPLDTAPSAAPAAVALPQAGAIEMDGESAASAMVVPSKQTTPPTGAGAVTTISFENTGVQQSLVPVTFGQVFAVGDLPKGQTVTGKLPDGTSVPLQVDVKARHGDDSLRHAVISALLPRLQAGQTLTMSLVKTASATTPLATTPAALLKSGFSAEAKLLIDGVSYSASADALLRAGDYKTWLSGNVVNEWQVAAPFKTASGIAHPHLMARFAIRAVTGTARARVDLTIENGWAFQAAPQNFTYDVQILVGGASTYSKVALNHLHHARWRRIDWWGGAPQVNVRHNTAYLIATKAVPNYDQSIVIPEAVLANLKSKWTGTKIEPMGVGLALPYMPTTGGRSDIGLMPSWSAIYLLTMDKRAKEVMLGTADLAGSYGAHFRDQISDRPVSIVDFPYMTIYGRQTDTYNRAAKRYENFPACATPNGCVQPNSVDTSHQPAFAYLPYLVTGDYYYLEELQFYGMWNALSDNPNYRGFEKGLTSGDQVRGQAWTMRTFGEAAYITPDADPLKAHFMGFVTNNLDWYNANYSTSASANKLGVIVNGYAYSYSDGTAIAPWQDDFFTAAIGHLNDLGFTKAAPLLAYKAKFSIDRMTAPGTCWIDAAIYNLKLRDTSKSPVYANIQQAYDATENAAYTGLKCDLGKVAAFFKLQVGEMTGYSDSNVGYPSNMQPALAYSAQVSGATGLTAWTRFMGRRVKPDYSWGPQFAIVPR